MDVLDDDLGASAGDSEGSAAIFLFGPAVFGEALEGGDTDSRIKSQITGDGNDADEDLFAVRFGEDFPDGSGEGFSGAERWTAFEIARLPFSPAGRSH